MAKEHHCPNCGPQACNASTSKIHTCGVCAAVWEEVISDAVPARPPAAAAPAPAPAAPATPAKPTTPTAPPANKPAGPSPTPATAPVAAAPAATAPNPASPAPPVAKPAAPTPTPASALAPPAPVAPAPPPPAPATAVHPPPSGSVVGIDRPAPGVKRLADVVAAAKVKLCPQCRSDNLKQPMDYLEVTGRIVLMDSQSYRPHMWFADTGEAYAPPSAVASAPAAPAAKAG